MLLQAITSISREEAIDLYRTLLNQETSRFNTFISILLGAFALQIGLNIWWNRRGAKKFIRKRVEEVIIKKEIEFGKKLEEQFKKVMKNEVSDLRLEVDQIELNVNRSIAFSTREFKYYGSGAYYWAKAINSAMKTKNSPLVRVFVDALIGTLEKNKETTHRKVIQLPQVLKIIDKIPDVLKNEKDKLKTLLSEYTSVD